MLKILLPLAFVALALASCNTRQETTTTPNTSPGQTGAVDLTMEPEPDSLLRHVVLFSFKNTSTPEQMRQVEQAFSALPDQIDEIYDYEWGTNVSPENLAQGYTHCFLVSFRSEADRDAYLPHPAHKEFGGVLRPHLDKVLVVDFWGSDR
ncbi:hypothetical protein BH24BAC1_BH24BAC1_04980 [soil metagenome]